MKPSDIAKVMKKMMMQYSPKVKAEIIKEFIEDYKEETGVDLLEILRGIA